MTLVSVLLQYQQPEVRLFSFLLEMISTNTKKSFKFSLFLEPFSYDSCTTSENVLHSPFLVVALSGTGPISVPGRVVFITVLLTGAIVHVKMIL